MMIIKCPQTLQVIIMKCFGGRFGCIVVSTSPSYLHKGKMLLDDGIKGIHLPRPTKMID